MSDMLLFGLLADARRARPRRFKLFNAHLDEYLSENNVKSKSRFGRDSINYLAVLLCNDLARKAAFRNILPSPWALTIGPIKKSGANFRKFPWANGTVFLQYGRR